MICSILALLALKGPVDVPDQADLKLASDYFESTNGQAMLVIVDGKIIFERYSNGGGQERLQMLASGSKSFVGVTAVAAVEDGLIKLDDKACESLTEWKSDPKKSKITYRQLLSLSSGLTAGEKGSVAKMESWKDIINEPMQGEPGAKFVYGAYHLNAFGEALQRKLKAKFGETFEQYLKRRVLDPIGVKVVWRNRCADGNPQLGGGATMTARDWAQFGEFLRLGGRWKGKQVIASSLLQECVKSAPTNPAYGLTFWLCQPVPPRIIAEVPLLRADMADIISLPWMPRDMFMAAGAGKQRCYVIPSRHMVVVRMGPLLGGNSFSDAEFLSRLLRGQVLESAPKARGRLLRR